MSCKPILPVLLLPVLLCCNFVLHAQHGSVEKQRIKRVLSYETELTIATRDSIVFYYSGTNGSVFEPTAYLGSARTGFNIFDVDNGVNISPRDVTNNPILTNRPNVLYDSAHHYGYYGGNENIITLFNTYHDSLLTGIERSYDHNNVVSSRIQFFYNQEKWPVAAYTTNTKDGVNSIDTLKAKLTTYKNGLPVSNTYYDYKTKEYTYGFYSYDSRDRLQYTASADTAKERSIYEYDDKDKLIEHRYERTTDGSTWKPDFTSIYEYDNRDRIINFTNYDDEGKIYVQFRYHYNSNGDADTQYIQLPVSSGVIPCLKAVFHFNSFHNPDSAIIYRGYCGNEPLQVSKVIYEYESYYEVSAADTGLLVVYPNPTTGLLHIQWNSKLPKDGAYINVYNATGQVMKRLHISQPKYTDEIDLGHLSAGVYYLHIADAQNKNLYKGSIVVAPQ